MIGNQHLILFTTCVLAIATPITSYCSGSSSKLNLRNGRFRIDSSRSYKKNSVIVANCNRNYNLFGDKILICDGRNWITRPGKPWPRCQEKKCKHPSTIENGIYYYRKGLEPRKGGTKVFYKCNPGFKMVSRVNYLFCQKRNKRWRGQVPKCQKKAHCDDPGDIQFGARIGDDFEEGSKVRFECSEGNNLTGSSTLECLSNSRWDHEIPYCKPTASCKIPTIQDIPHSVIFLDNPKAKFMLPGEFLYIECQKGFKVIGISFLECQDNEMWDSEFPRCETVAGCPPVLPLENGKILETDLVNVTVKHGTSLHFLCNKSYHIVGSSWIECVYDEFKGLSWSSQPPRCQATLCSDHNPPENGLKLGKIPFYVGSTVTYTCYKGYQLIGSRNRTCTENGVWSGSLATCYDGNSVCPNPGVPINGIKIGNRYNTDDVVVFKCKPGYFHFGNKTRVCQSNGYWSGSETLCRGSDEFDDIGQVSARILTEIDTLKLVSEHKTKISSQLNESISRTLDINNPEGLNLIFIFDSSGSIGKQGFATAKKFASTLVKYIGVSSDGVRVAAITFSSDVMVNFYTMEFLTTEEVIEQIELIKYNPGDTATNPALMKARTDVIPAATKSRPGSSTALFLITDGRANIRGRPKEEADLITKEYDIEIYAIGVGRSILEEELASIAYPKNDVDRHYMKIESFTKMDEMLQLLINGTIDYSACGLLQRKMVKKPNGDSSENGDEVVRNKRSLRMRIVGGQKVSKRWPWMAGLFYSATSDFTDGQLQCGGSLISNNWVMTAAHCVKLLIRKRTITYTKDNIRIHLGIINFKKPDKSSLIIGIPDLIIIHPEYDLKTLNNDIALIRLSEPVRYNALIRPVCLPPPISKIPKDSFLYKPGELAIVTGWGHTKQRQKFETLSLEDLKQSPELKKLVLPIQDDKICNKSLQLEILVDKLTDSMLCAGTGEGKQDSCTTDSGGPLHQREEDPDGDGIFYTQVGIVSWGLGCALEGEYGFYTKVAKFVPWIEEKTGKKFSSL